MLTEGRSASDMRGAVAPSPFFLYACLEWIKSWIEPKGLQYLILGIMVFQPLKDAIGGRVVAKKLTIPLFVAHSNKTVGDIRIGKIYTDYQRRWFFRIGLFPEVVLLGVRCSVDDGNAFRGALEKLRRPILVSAAGEMIEMIDVRCSFAQGPRRVLELGHVRIDRGGRWLLDQGVTYQGKGRKIHGETGTLQVSGPRAGQLRLEGKRGLVVIRLWSAGGGTVQGVDPMRRAKPSGNTAAARAGTSEADGSGNGMEVPVSGGAEYRDHEDSHGL